MNDDLFKPMLILSNTTTPREALESLLETSKTTDGCSKLASKNILPPLLRLCQILARTSSENLLLPALNLLKNLCDPDLLNITQNYFNTSDAYEVISCILEDVCVSSSDLGTIHMAFEVLRTMSFEEHHYGIWHQCYPEKFIKIASVSSAQACDVLCNLIHTCCDREGQLRELCGDEGLPIIERIIVTASASSEDEAYTGEHGLLVLFSKLCVEEDYFPRVFSWLFNLNDEKYTQLLGFDTAYFNKEQTFLMRIIWKIFYEPKEINEISPYFVACVYEIFKRAVKLIDDLPKAPSGVPTGSTWIDILGYSIMVLRHICDKNHRHPEVYVELLVSTGLVELLLYVLSDLGPPKKCEKCPYKGYRVDIVSTLGHCLLQRKHVQDELKERNGIILLLQQCDDDEDNEDLKRHGIQTVKNFMEGSRLNRKLVLEFEGSDDVPDISGLF